MHRQYQPTRWTLAVAIRYGVVVGYHSGVHSERLRQRGIRDRRQQQSREGCDPLADPEHRRYLRKTQARRLREERAYEAAIQQTRAAAAAVRRNPQKAVVTACRAGAYRLPTQTERRRAVQAALGCSKPDLRWPYIGFQSPSCGRLPGSVYKAIEAAHERHERRHERRQEIPRAELPISARWPGIRDERVRDAVRGAYNRCGYRLGDGAGDRGVRVHLGDTPGAKASIDERWPKRGEVAKSYRYRVRDVTHELHVRHSWREDVASRGLAVVDDLLTLDAQPCAGTVAYEEAYNAVWVEQGRGCSIHHRAGVIYRSGPSGEWIHGAMLASCRRTAGIRKEDFARPDRLPGVKLDTVIELTLALSAAHAGTIGVCAPGVRDWCEKHLPGRESASVREILAVAASSGDRVGLVRVAVRRLAKMAA